MDGDHALHGEGAQAEEVAASNKGKASAVVGDILLLRCYCYLVAIAAVVLYLPVVLVRARSERNAEKIIEDKAVIEIKKKVATQKKSYIQVLLRMLYYQ